MEDEEDFDDSPRKQLRRTLASGKWIFDIECESEIATESKMLTLLDIPNTNNIIADSGKLNSFHIRSEVDLSIICTINHDLGSLYTGIIKND